jgi:TPR repeat protein
MLLDTARGLIERDGEEAVTLGAIADEAGLARATIYGYFSGKRELLAALNLEPVPSPETAPAAPEESTAKTWMDYEPELAELAPETHVLEDTPVEEVHSDAAEEVPASPVADDAAADTEEPAAVEATAPDHLEDAPQANEHEAEAAPDAPVEPVEEVPAIVQEPEETVTEATAEPDASQLLTPHEQDRRTQAAHLEEIAKRLILPQGASKEGTDALISRLETRLRVLERSIAGLETRQNAAAEEAARKIKPVSDVVVQLQSRADTIEDRQRQAIAELRLSIHELNAKQGAFGAQPIMTPELPVWPEGPVDFTPIKSDEAPVEESSTQESSDESGSADDKSRHAYLSTARNLAKEGARQAAERESIEEEEQRGRRKRLLTAAGVAAACLIAVGAIYLIHPGSHGVSVAQSKSLAPKIHRVAVSGAPLDRLTALANKGDTRAELLIGLKYLKGDGIAANEAEAAHWFQRAANAGDPVAQNHLGALYQAGRGVPVDLTQAAHWYEAAASKGDRHAMSNLAVLYAGASGGQKNLAEASRWFERAAMLGYVDAQFNLAVLYERGDGVPQSLLDAYKWYSIAAAAGDPVAKSRADAIATQVAPEELQAAQQAAASFKPQPMNRAANEAPTMAEVLASAR